MCGEVGSPPQHLGASFGDPTLLNCQPEKIRLSQVCNFTQNQDLTSPDQDPLLGYPRQQRIQGALGDWALPCPQDFFKIMQFSGTFRGKPLFWANFGLRPPLWVKIPLVPLTKILDPRLYVHLVCLHCNLLAAAVLHEPQTFIWLTPHGDQPVSCLLSCLQAVIASVFWCHKAPFTQDAEAHLHANLHANPLILLAMLCEHSNRQQCVPFFHARFASTSASCVNGA